MTYTEEEIRRLTLPLEDVQRIYLGRNVGLYEAEPMEFSAESIAAMLQDIADASSLAKACAIHAVVRALRGLDQHHRLELRQVRQGKHKLAHHRAADRSRNQKWLDKLATHERNGMKTEAAIAAIAEEWKVSRATVFAGIKFAELCLEMQQSENPRPSKSDLD